MHQMPASTVFIACCVLSFNRCQLVCVALCIACVSQHAYDVSALICAGLLGVCGWLESAWRGDRAAASHSDVAVTEPPHYAVSSSLAQLTSAASDVALVYANPGIN